jgi:mannose-6-phosphate isomerase
MPLAPFRLSPFRLSPWYSPRPWGSRNLLPWYDKTVSIDEEPIGEAWLTGEDCVVESGAHRGLTLAQLTAKFPGELLGTAASGHDYPLLLKLIFPTQKLSVQVHPDDAMARSLGFPRGKTECWYCLEAAPNGAVALGLESGVTVDAVRKAVADQTLEQLLHQVHVNAGDMIFVDAGTVHAIEPGTILLETQQQSDITYRLYDYGRPRELHVDLALQALRPSTQAGKVQPLQLDAGATQLIQQRYFTVVRYEMKAGETRAISAGDMPLTFVALAGDVALTTPGAEAVVLGHVQAVVLPPLKEEEKCELRAREDATVICAIPGKL